MISKFTSICGLLALLVAPAIQAQLAVESAQAELAIPFGSAAGNITAAGDVLTFVPADSAAGAFAIRRANIRNVSVTQDVLTLETVEAINGSNTFNFRLLSGDVSRMAEWARGNALSTPMAAPGVAPAAGGASSSRSTAGAGSGLELTYQAKHGHRFGSGCTGQVRVRGDRLSYDSTDNLDHSRQWQLKEIKEFKRKNPYKIVIDPFVGGKYDLDLIGGGMSSKDFQAVTGAISEARKP